MGKTALRRPGGGGGGLEGPRATEAERGQNNLAGESEQAHGCQTQIEVEWGLLRVELATR